MCEFIKHSADDGTDEDAGGGEDQGIRKTSTIRDVAKEGSRREQHPTKGA